MTQLHGMTRRAVQVAGTAMLGGVFLVAPALAAEVTGTAGDDVLSGTASADVISGLGGDDLLHGRAGADQLEGGVGDDVIIGDRGADVIDWAAGREPLQVPDGTDVMRGGYGPDAIGTRDGDHAWGGGQKDRIFNWQDNGSGVVIHGGDGGDQVSSFACAFDCEGAGAASGSKPARLYGDAGADRLDLDNPSGAARGGPGDDYLEGRRGHALFGGDGDDHIKLPPPVIYFEPAGQVDRIAGGRGDDEIDTSLGTINGSLSCGPGNDLLFTSTKQPWPSDCEVTYFHLWGTFDCVSECYGADAIVGTDENDWVDAFWDDDTVKSLGGDDRLFLGSGSDTADAGAGDDDIDAAADDDNWRQEGWADDIACGPGDDTLIANPNDTYSADCETVTIK